LTNAADAGSAGPMTSRSDSSVFGKGRISLRSAADARRRVDPPDR
jgi:hypothetical protein